MRDTRSKQRNRQGCLDSMEEKDSKGEQEGWREREREREEKTYQKQAGERGRCRREPMRGYP